MFIKLWSGFFFDKVSLITYELKIKRLSEVYQKNIHEKNTEQLLRNN